LYYTASGIITLCRWPSGAQVGTGLSPLPTCAPDSHLQCDDTRCTIIQFWPQNM